MSLQCQLNKKKKVHNCIAGYEGKVYNDIRKKINVFKNGYHFNDLFTIKHIFMYP